LRAHPSTKDTAKSYREQGNENYPSDHGYYEKVKVLGPKRKSKDIETPLQYIEHQELVPVHFYKWR
jgi:hypothetical protein